MSSEPLAQRVYRLLADRRFHSGAVLARENGVTRSAIWKAVASLAQLGVPVHAVRHRGYRLPSASAPLDARRIIEALPRTVAARLRDGRTVWCVGSTNTELLERPALPAGQFDFLAAEYQTAGRGRRTRRWFAPPGGAICLSLSWTYPSLPVGAAALGLAIGVCVLGVLREAGLADVQLKWPNDLVADGAKLGGILIELRAESAGPACVVVGIGLNVALGAQLTGRVQASGTLPTDLAHLGMPDCDRNGLAAGMLAAAVKGLELFGQRGFAPFAPDWRLADALAGKAVTVSADGCERVSGHARGIDLNGALCVQTRQGLERFVSGEVSVRLEG